MRPMLEFKLYILLCGHFLNQYEYRLTGKVNGLDPAFHSFRQGI
jgi:hypothetical protein